MHNSHMHVLNSSLDICLALFYLLSIEQEGLRWIYFLNKLQFTIIIFASSTVKLYYKVLVTSSMILSRLVCLHQEGIKKESSGARMVARSLMWVEMFEQGAQVNILKFSKQFAFFWRTRLKWDKCETMSAWTHKQQVCKR